MNKMIKCLVMFAAIFAAACTTGSAQTARTNGAGNFQFGIEPGVFGAAAANSAGGGIGMVPSFNLAGRYGVSDAVDIGARIGSVGYEVQAKIMFTDPSDQQSIAMSIAPQVTAIGAGGSGGGAFFFRSAIPFLIGLPVGKSEFTFGPRVSPWFITAGGGGSGASGFILMVGGEVGFAGRVADKFWLMPHLALDYPLVGAAGGGGSGVSGSIGGGVIFGAGLALLFGGRGPADGAPPSAAPAAPME